MTWRSFALVTLTLALLGGCAQLALHGWAEAAPKPVLAVPATDGATPWTGTEPLDAPGSFHFAVVTESLRDDIQIIATGLATFSQRER